ncbi:NAD(P)/FAD-dependent oxidoreductase [Aquabacterium sp. J223]|uniref:NAD(P)/FAD-dependent oxidoreductase n=1 Tax=Aquabacterium sp. J223 TaxID=2898431 RepID=UPI0021ADE9BD|nr:NAD(P)/FAD-dependent oxidoreductase [Aquabacterium sp. J223]UUX97476.1 NAD(P)/FAD-dependent oxidoreductase [Aquabacterium sp. J223]
MTVDALVIGAGPVGLWQAFQLGLQGLRCAVVDALPFVGGQCAELYPDKPIYDIPGLPRCSGGELVERLQQQLAPFAVERHLGQEVTSLQRRADGRFDVATEAGTRLDAGVVVIAGGLGAFTPKRLRVEGLRAFEGRQVFHHRPDDAVTRGRHVVVAGDTESTLSWALALAEGRAAARITVVHRRDHWRAEPATVSRFHQALAAGDVHLSLGQPVGLAEREGRLVALTLATAEGAEVQQPLDLLLVGLGLSPQLGPVAHWGLAMERRLLTVDTERFQTSEPGIFAVGDINHYPGKRKLIVCGFHEATLAAFAAAEHLHPGERVPLQYTTTSPALQQRLGVAGDTPI